MSKKNEGRENRKPVAQLESQDDIGYVTGHHDPKEKDKQVKTPVPRRQQSKAREAARGERR